MRVRAFFALLALAAAAQAQPAFQVRDINTSGGLGVAPPGGLGSRPHQLTPTRGKLFFRTGGEFEGSIWATDGMPGGTLRLPGDCNDEDCFPRSPRILGSLRNLAFWVGPRPGATGLLWRSDGTWAGTFPLNDPEALAVSPPESSSAPLYAFAGNFLYFPGCSESGSFHPDCELWRTDGTREGTRLVADVVPGSLGSNPIWLTAVGNRVFFVAFGPGDSPALWVSNGTAAGTFRLREFANAGFSPPRLLTAAGNRLFFLAETGDEEELWVSDGTAAGTRAVSRFAPRNPFGPTGWIKPLGNHVYFLANDVEHGVELWRSDGTAAGTVRVTEFGYHLPFGESDFIHSQQIAEAAGGRIVFLATDGVTGFKYWTTSGTPESTAAVAAPCSSGDCHQDESLILTSVGGRVVLTIDEHSQGMPWSTDGTPGGTVRLANASMQSRPFALAGAVFFHAGGDLWRTNGRPEGTRRFADLPSSTRPPFDPQEMESSGGRIYFNLDGPYGEELWASDGSPGGTALVADLLHLTGPGSGPHDLAAFGGRLLFFATQDRTTDLWQSSGTAESTVALAVAPSQPSGCSVTPLSSLVLAGGKAFFLRQDPSCKVSFWATDGTPAGTVQLPRDNASTPQDPFRPIAHQGRLFFLAQEGDSTAIWKSDGTVPGTGRAFDLPTGVRGPSALTSAGPDLYFAALDEEGRRQVWRSDGTTGGTKRLTSFDEEHQALSLTPQFTRVGNTVFFRISDPGFFFDFGGLGATDGTLAGTRELLAPFSSASAPQGLIAFKGALYFFLEKGGTDEAPWALWRSDGTVEGTVPVRALGVHDEDFPIEPTIMGDELFFVFGSVDHGRELWTTDGTSEGTRRVRDIFPGPASSWPAQLAAAAGKLYFQANDGLHGVEPWVSDGTEAGTRMIQDLSPLSDSSHPTGFTGAGGFLFFAADDGVSGTELWALPLGPGSGACRPSPTHLCLSNGRFRVEASWRDFSGRAGRGQAVALTPDTGYFWFFDPANVEAIVKVLDGRGVNEHHWVFYGALSNVEYSITVTDTQTGLTRRYFNPSGSFASVGDTQGFGPSWTPAVKAASVAGAAPAPLVSERTDPAAKAAPCVASATRLCLNGGRFAVEVAWKDFSGNTGAGKAVGLTGDTGYFWFFDDDNVELVLKVLDGRPVNGRFWVFYGALSSVEYTITVTDTETGTVRTYKNPSGRLASVGDTGAF
jgi:ELWxxDGT repeat protein